MTKLREPASIENTLRLMLAELTLDVAADVTGRAPSYLHALTDPDKREQLTIRDQLLLDGAHNARFGRGWPLYRTIGLMLETSDAHGDAIVLHRHVVDLAREFGEATAGVAMAALTAHSAGALDHALSQLEEAHTVCTSAITSVRALKGRVRDGPVPDTS